MHIQDLLLPNNVAVTVRTSNKIELLEQVTNRLAERMNLPSPVIVSAILKREELGSTGTGGGVAIPHARIPMIQKASGFLARLDRAIEFDAIDGQPVDLIFVLLLPIVSDGKPPLHALACVARKLRQSDVLLKLRLANNQTELYAAIAD